LRGLHLETGLTTVFVTHDQEEAMELADRVVIMREGVIEQTGTPAEIYAAPATPFVCDFLGNALKFDTTCKNGEADVLGARFAVETSGAAVAYVRNHEINVSADPSEGVSATLRASRIAGPMVALEFSAPIFQTPVEILLPQVNVAADEFVPGRAYGLKARSASIFPLA
jgi:sulfate transport system ATP-binding protein